MRTILFFTLAGALLLSSCANETTPEQTWGEALPNVIMLVGDDQGYPYFGFMGADYMQTPNMDTLAASGMLFTGQLCERQPLSVPTDLAQRDVAHRLLLSAAGAQRDSLISALSIPEDSIAGFTREFDLRAKHMANFATLPALLKEKGYVSFQGEQMVGIHF